MSASVPIAMSPAVQSRLSRVGVRVTTTGSGGPALEIDPTPRPVVDKWTAGRFVVWAGAGALGLDRGTAYMVAAVWELIELQWGREVLDTLPNRAADLVAAAGGFEVGRHVRRRLQEEAS